MNKYKRIVARMRVLDGLHKKEIKARFDKYGLYPGQPYMLRIVYENPGMTQVELAEKLRITPASVAVSTKRLEKQGFIEKKDDEYNLRINKLLLTDLGNKTVVNIQEEFDAIDRKLFTNVNEEEMDLLCSLYNKLIINLSGLEKDNYELLDEELCKVIHKLNEEGKKND